MATARVLKFTEEDLTNEGGGGAYAELEVPGDFPIRLREVDDYDKRSENKSWGWVFTYGVETPSGTEVDFRVWLSFGPKARWKLRQVLEAHGVHLEAGDLEVDPEELIGDELIGHIDFPRNKQGEPTSEFRELLEIYPISSEPPDFPEGEPTTQDDEPDVL